jgi:hypothetical protein
MKFKIKDGHPKMSVIYKSVKYVLADLDELPDEVFKYAVKGDYGIVKVKEEKKDVSIRSK